LKRGVVQTETETETETEKEKEKELWQGDSPDCADPLSIAPLRLGRCRWTLKVNITKRVLYS